MVRALYFNAGSPGSVSGWGTNISHAAQLDQKNPPKPVFKMKKKKKSLWSSGWDSALSLPRMQIQSLVMELRSCKLCRTANK